jgi:hypothetical protein
MILDETGMGGDDELREEQTLRLWVNSLGLGAGQWKCLNLASDLTGALSSVLVLHQDLVHCTFWGCLQMA